MYKALRFKVYMIYDLGNSQEMKVITNFESEAKSMVHLIKTRSKFL